MATGRIEPIFWDVRMADGSRHFADLPENYDPAVPEWLRIRDHVALLAGAQLTGFVTDQVTEAWIDLAYAGRAFSLNNQQGRWWMFVDDPDCPPEILARVFDHFESLLDPAAAHARRFGPIARWRAIVLEPDGRTTHRDFADLDTARRYADDASSETEDGVAIAYVVDAELCLVHRGRHY